MSPIKAVVILAEGAEEMETVIIVDMLRRGQMEVVVASLNDDHAGGVKCSRNVSIVADCSLKQVMDEPFDAVVLPGGAKGAQHLAASPLVKTLLVAQEKAGKVIGAVCAAPTVLAAHGIGRGKKITSYPSFKAQLEQDYEYVEQRVVEDEFLVTSRGPGTCFEFSLALVQKLVSKDVADSIKEGALISI